MMRAQKVLTRLEVPVLVAVPLVLALCAVFQLAQTAILSLVVILASLMVFFVNYEASRPALRQIMPTVVLAALAAAGRILFAAIPSFKPITAICIVSGAVFGRRSGFMVGALAALVSNFFFGQGPWTPWQMYAWGMIGYFAGVLGDHGLFKHQPVVLVYGVVAAYLYSVLLNSWFLIGFVNPITWQSALLTYGASLPLDTVHAVATVAFLLVIFTPWRRKLERVKIKYGASGYGG